MDKNKKTGYIVSHTHWDREWRYTIWETREWLISFIDELVDVLETGKYKGFMMDGQVVPILDYLEARPEMDERVRSLIKAGKLQVGPWYCLPDEYPVDGEAMVRNLLKGKKIAEELGQNTNIGYTPFGWGQTAQLPQIYKEFGMDTAFIGKRVNKERAPKAEFKWQAPDGSELLSSRFGEMGRSNFYFLIHLTALYNQDHMGWGWKAILDGTQGVPFHRTDKEQMEQDFFRIDAPKDLYLDVITPELADLTWNSTRESVMENDRLMVNGCDYAASQPMVPQMIERLQEVDKDENRQWIQATLPEFVEVMKKNINISELPLVKGELRDGPVGFNTGNALSTRLYLKILNKKAQNLLIRFAEPFAILNKMRGVNYSEYLLEKAWTFLLDSHPHDSINGVTQDKTARDVENRLEQVIDIAQTLSNRAMKEMVKDIDLSAFEKDDVILVVFNSLPYERNEVVESYITFPREMKHNRQFTDDMGFLQVYDNEGSAMSTQWEGVEDVDYCYSEVHARALPLYGHRHKIYFETGKIPACGYKVFRIGKDDEIRPENVEWSDNQAQTSSILKSPGVLENDHLKIEINPNGTFNMLDKNIRKEWKSLNYFEDKGEHGTYWINYKPMHQKSINSLGSNANIWVEENGPLQATLVSKIVMNIPQKGYPKYQSRGDNFIAMPIRTYITLKKNARQVDVRVEFNNQAEEHYLRVLFPTEISGAETAESGGHFVVDSRNIRAQGPTKQSAWKDMATLPMNNFVDISNDDIGMAFLSDCLTEYEVLEDDKKTVALSLLRAVKTWIVTGHVGSDFPSQKGGNCFGNHAIKYSIKSHSGNWESANIPLDAEFVNTPVIPIQTNSHKGKLPAKSQGMLKIENSNIRFSSLKKSETSENIVLRMYNPSSIEQITKVRFYQGLEKVWKVKLNEKRIEELPVNKNEFEVNLPAYKIVSIEIEY